MVIDLLGRTILQEIQKVPGFEGAVIAGGFCRDHILGGNWKDIDIFYPNHKDIFGMAKKLSEAKIENFDILDTLESYDLRNRWISKKFVGLINCEYLGAIRVQIIGYNLPKEDFGKNVVSEFSYGIDQAWTEDGETIKVSDAFTKDKNYGTATLLIPCKIPELPGNINKFLRLQKKYPNRFSFSCPDLEFKKRPTENKQNRSVTNGTNQFKNWAKGRKKEYEAVPLAEIQAAQEVLQQLGINDQF